jgi:hypothetical protein
MQVSPFNIIRISLIALILIVLSVQPFLPPKREQLHPHPGNLATLYSDEAWGGKTSATWVDEGKTHWRCNLVQSGVFTVCGIAIEFSRIRDLTGFDALSVQIKYTGDAKKLRFYLRNHNPAYSTLQDVDSLKFNAITLQTNDLAKSETIVHLSEFSVADWWLEERDIPRELSRPELDRVATVGLDFPPPPAFGPHEIEIERIELIGAWIRPERLYLSIILLGIVFLTAEALIRFAYLRRTAKRD